MMKFKDTRVSIINDALKGIKTIKVVQCVVCGVDIIMLCVNSLDND